MERKKLIKVFVLFLSVLLIISSAPVNMASATGKDPKTAYLLGEKSRLQQTVLSKNKSNPSRQALKNKQELKTKYVADELIITYKNSASAATIKNKHALKTKQKLKSIGAEVVKVNKDSNIDSLIKT